MEKEDICKYCSGTGWIYEKHDSNYGSEKVSCICHNEFTKPKEMFNSKSNKAAFDFVFKNK